MSIALQIVSFDVPFPADYGGVIDVFYKLKSLANAGVKIHLHCFTKGRKKQSILSDLCEKVYYYQRRNPLLSLGNSKPHIVASRKNRDLLNNLSNYDIPILFEGLHSCYYLDREELAGHFKMVRMHNVEWQYYEGLAKQSEGLKKIYFETEAGRLKNFEQEIGAANLILGITEKDRDYYRQFYDQVEWLPCFHPSEKLEMLPGLGQYLLYHGNLSVPENEQAAKAICKKIAPESPIPVVIAGKDPSSTLVALAEARGVKIVPNPSDEELTKLMKEAQMHLLWTEQDTGIKLKLINALCTGRHVLANEAMTAGTKLSILTHQVNSVSECLIKINELKDVELSADAIEIRRTILNQHYLNTKNAQGLIKLIQQGA